eukprot:2608859-Amphidinium_carterae.1
MGANVTRQLPGMRKGHEIASKNEAFISYVAINVPGGRSWATSVYQPSSPRSGQERATGQLPATRNDSLGPRARTLRTHKNQRASEDKPDNDADLQTHECQLSVMTLRLNECHPSVVTLKLNEC